MLRPEDRIKLDNNDDRLFYSRPKFVHHLDAEFRARLTKLYIDELDDSLVLLDLMSSWVSHLPKESTYKRVLGHGLNTEELRSNKILDSFWVQNLNENQNIPLEDQSIDTVLIVAGWQYLQYPEGVSNELFRIVKPNGKIIVSFSNRAFWQKCPNIWRLGNPQDHLNYISSVLTASGWTIKKCISEKLPTNFISSLFRVQSDPFFCVVAKR